MLVVLFAVFFILHGLVHLLYLGQSQRFFELQPGMTWPDGSWLFSRFLSPESTRLIASVLLVLAALAFAGSGLGLLLKQDWWRRVSPRWSTWPSGMARRSAWTTRASSASCSTWLCWGWYCWPAGRTLMDDL
jgi:hypothetical protein